MAKVLFEGTKTFWKTKNSVSITIVEHCGHDVLEVVAYEPNIDVEAPRLYIDMEYITSFLDMKLEVLANDETALANTLTAFVFNRVCMAQFLPISKVLEIAIQSGFGEKEQGIDYHVMIPRPPDLVPYSVKRSVVSPRSVLLRENWRIPLILVRLIKGLPLRGPDKEIYERFAAGKSKPELVETVARALRAKVTTTDDAVLKEVAHAIVLEPQSPFPSPKFCAPNPHSLPPGFADSVKAAEASRFSSRPSSPGRSGASSPRSVGSSRGRTLRDLFRLPGTSKSVSSSCPSSAGTSVSSTPGASLPSSPGHSRRSSLVSVPNSTGVAFAPKTLKNSTSVPALSALLAGFEGYHSSYSSANPSATSSARSEKAVKPPLGLTCPTAATTDMEDDDGGLRGISIGRRYKLGVGYVQSKPTQRLAALRGRRRTFDTETDLAMSPTSRAILQSSYPASTAGGGAVCAGVGGAAKRMGVAAGGHHVRAASGGTLSALLGFASAMGGHQHHHRVAPSNAWSED